MLDSVGSIAVGSCLLKFIRIAPLMITDTRSPRGRAMLLDHMHPYCLCCPRLCSDQSLHGVYINAPPASRLVIYALGPHLHEFCGDPPMQSTYFHCTCHSDIAPWLRFVFLLWIHVSFPVNSLPHRINSMCRSLTQFSSGRQFIARRRNSLTYIFIPRGFSCTAQLMQNLPLLIHPDTGTNACNHRLEGGGTAPGLHGTTPFR
ncbi:hypothetical protein B0H10DRAFT_996767 [Mycena sp. CBHHK59/15]|nr:hypothetical protein B0H10DRAFT_996767 [Mycena sp. CBHHK59/15]